MEYIVLILILNVQYSILIRALNKNNSDDAYATFEDIEAIEVLEDEGDSVLD